MKVNYQQKLTANQIATMLIPGLNTFAKKVAGHSYDYSPHQSGALRVSTRVANTGPYSRAVQVGGIGAVGDITGEYKMVNYAPYVYKRNKTGRPRFIEEGAKTALRQDLEASFGGLIR